VRLGRISHGFFIQITNNFPLFPQKANPVVPSAPFITAKTVKTLPHFHRFINVNTPVDSPFQALPFSF
jgi:hypothetical protein